jgi:hypothetical protein
VERALEFLKEGSLVQTDPYALACTALVAQGLGADEVARDALARLRPLAVPQRTGVYWDPAGNTPFLGWGRAGRIETTALALQALSNEDRTLASRGLLFLLQNKDQHGMWWSGQATVNVLDAIIGELGGATTSDGKPSAVKITVNGAPVGTLELPSDSQVRAPIALDLTPLVVVGKNSIEVERADEAGVASVQALASSFVGWGDTPLHSTEVLRLDVGFDKVEARIGEPIEVKVEAGRTGVRGYGMVLAEVGLPPGVDVDRESLDAVVADGSSHISFYEIQPGRVVLYITSGPVSCRFRIRPRFAMNAQSAASTLYDYYNPDAWITKPPMRFTIRE